MGIALKLNADGTFQYWAYSDVVLDNEPKYPVSGSWIWNGAVIELNASQIIHDHQWFPCHLQGETCLQPGYAHEWQQKDGKLHEDRFLFRTLEFDEKHPFAQKQR